MIDPTGLYLYTDKGVHHTGDEIDLMLHSFVDHGIATGNPAVLELLVPWILSGRRLKCCAIVNELFEGFVAKGVFVRLQGPTPLKATQPLPMPRSATHEAPRAVN